MHIRQRTLASVSGLALVIGCSVGKLFDAPPTKVIGVTPARVVDSVQAGSGASRLTSLLLWTTGGDQPRGWTAHRANDAPWLTVSADAGSAPDTVDVAIGPTDLPPGSYRDTIVIVPDDPGAAQLFVPVELRIVDSTTTPPPPPPPATQLAFTGNPPASIVLNSTFSVEVTARDAQGATATDYSGTISLTLEGPVITGGLSGTTSVNAVNGIATFSDLHVTGLCTSCTLRAAASGLAGATSSAFVVVSP